MTGSLSWGWPSRPCVTGRTHWWPSHRLVSKPLSTTHVLDWSLLYVGATGCHFHWVSLPLGVTSTGCHLSLLHSGANELYKENRDYLKKLTNVLVLGGMLNIGTFCLVVFASGNIWSDLELACICSKLVEVLSLNLTTKHNNNCKTYTFNKVKCRGVANKIIWLVLYQDRQKLSLEHGTAERNFKQMFSVFYERCLQFQKI